MSTTAQDLRTIDLPFKKLLAWEENVRTNAAEEGIGELAASIAAVGLLQSLVVKKAPRGKFSVIAGKRRLAALSRLVDAGRWPATAGIPCRIVSSEADLTEVSLAENVQRKAMHPADEFVAFQRLIEQGRCVADIAARFGVTEAVVDRRLALARVSPVLLDKYRCGEMNLELLQAFTLTDGHELQEQIWNNLAAWDRRPDTVRQILSREAIPATDRCARFVGLGQYEAAGGAVRRDLFSEDGEGAYLLDPAKLLQLAGEKLAQWQTP